MFTNKLGTCFLCGHWWRWDLVYVWPSLSFLSQFRWKKVGKRAVLVGGWRGVGKVSWGRQGGETGGSSVGGNLWPGSTHPRTATCSVSHAGLCPVLMLECVLPRLGNMWRGISCALICWAVVNCVDWSAVKKCKNFRNEEKVAHWRFNMKENWKLGCCKTYTSILVYCLHRMDGIVPWISVGCLRRPQIKTIYP